MKIIVIDGGIFTHTSIFSYGARLEKKDQGLIKFVPQPHYIYFDMIISALKKIGVDKDDKVIIAQDGRNSWRKDIYAPYKAQRDAFRKSHENINWNKCYAYINQINENLKESTNFHFIQIPRIEADDIISTICRYYPENEIVIVTGDVDLEQLAYYPNVKIFSTNIKTKGTRGGYKIVKNPLKIIEKKSKNGDLSDNILVEKSDTIHDYDIRYKIVNLLSLPDWVEKAVINELDKIKEKTPDYSKLPFSNSLAKKFFQIYEKKNILDYNYCVQLQEKRKERQRKKARERYKLKKLEKQRIMQ